MNSQSEKLASQEIQETINGLANSLRSQVNDVHVHIESQEIYN